MKITVDSKSFVEAIQWATKGYDNKNDKAYVALTVNEDAEGVLSHTSLTTHLRSPFMVLDTEEAEEIAVALDGRYLQRLASALSTSGPAELTVKESGLTIKNSTGEFTVPRMSGKISAFPEVVKLGETPELELFDSLQRLAKLCDPTNAGLLPVLGLVDIRLSEEDRTITMMATDRYSLGEIVLDFDPSDDLSELVEEGKSLLLPYENATMVSPSKTGSLVELVYEKDTQKFGYSFSSGKVALFALKEANPLNYSSHKVTAKQAASNSFIVNAKELQKAIGVISNLDWNSPYIFLNVDSDTLVVSDTTASNTLEVPVESSTVENEFKIKFVRTVINSSFSPISTSRVKVNFENESKPFVLELVTENDTVADNVFVMTVPSED